MLLKTFISILDAHDANITSLLPIQDMVKFFCVAANVSSSVHQLVFGGLWEAAFKISKDCYIIAQHQVNFHGIMTELSDGCLPIHVVDQLLFTPVEHCPKCLRTMQPRLLFGYLYDIDGCHTIEQFHLERLASRCLIQSETSW
ncbi:uncharacterized protein MELLADRAFT_92624 [Melampsora larici-populina 98AG31]|uniref:CxC5 like cysteine cluster associated with KDZ domain-containing protein n=1 Tax=Melampsora larici-populina (strain 98AG31 / pathotype 3-4-7) TaxID=747676 RepID=F4S281_MELLP|nr:uncharacterized protein MELLADRAFT_92624 [Melampsora larici-populina 98AG31]EGG01127.1 hypothetical protein MELLADRAFT_92624 [Melampsora larici-populina 98AG31]